MALPRSSEHKSTDESILKTVPLHPLLATGGEGPTASVTSKRLPVAAISSVKANIRAGESSILQDSMTKRGRVSEPSAVDRFLAIRPVRATSTKNPHFDRSLPLANRGPRMASLKFVKPGSLIAEAEERRARETLEALRREVAESLASVGIDTDIVSDLMTAEGVPDVEWWDRPFRGTEVWNCLYREDMRTGTRTTRNTSVGANNHPSGREESVIPLENIITNLIQRPALLSAPLDDLQVQPRPLFLTMEERKKLRRQRRLAEHREQQERIKLGLLPPPPPKTRIANIARVLGVQAAAEPSRLEAELRAAAAERHARHVQTNRDRQEAAAKQTARGTSSISSGPHPQDPGLLPLLSVLVVRIEGNIHQIPQWRFKVTKNAQQYGLTGCMLSLAPSRTRRHIARSITDDTGPTDGGNHDDNADDADDDNDDNVVSEGASRNPPFTLVVAEGGATAIRRYKHLLLERIKWDQPPAPVTDNQGIPSNRPSDPMIRMAGEAGANIDDATNPHQDSKVMGPSSTRCSLVWEGQQSEAHYRGFVSQALPTELDILEYLTRHQNEHFWRAAKSLSRQMGSEMS